MQTMDTAENKWMLVSSAATQINRSERQIRRYINAGKISVSSFPGTTMKYVDIEELQAFINEKVKCKGCSAMFERSGKKEYHNTACKKKNHARMRRERRREIHSEKR